MNERRQHRRVTFSETAEVVDLASGARMSTRVADLSRKGCYLDSMNPFPVGSNVRVRIAWSETELTCAAVVRDSQPGMGMGVAFTALDDAQKALIDTWIERLSLAARTDPSPSSRPENAQPARPSGQVDALAVRLIDLLHGKGLLSANEVASLLRDRDL